MKRRIITVILIAVLLLTIPVSVICVGFCLPAQYTHTYYAVLPKMYQRLKTAEGKRIIVIGNSAIAFGLDVNLLENEFPDYTVCSFGLYGTVGTKAMIDLSKVNIRAGDIVILAPEQDNQSQSLYFNSEYVWNCVDGNFGMLKQIVNKKEMVGGFLGYVGRKYTYYKNSSTPNPKDVYASASFDENCNMIYDRPYNMLPLGYDNNSRISYDTKIFDKDFGAYVNEYNEYVTKQGATLLYGFTPVNVASIQMGTGEEDIELFYDNLNDELDCEILGHPNEYIFDSDWFYDSNVHMNTSGSTVYTRQLVADLKAYFGDSTPISFEIPEKPIVPDDTTIGEDGKDAEMFTYEESGSGWNITGLTEEGKSRTAIEIPDFYQGKRVYSFSSQTFAGNTVVEEIRLGSNIYGVADSSFYGCTSLMRLYTSVDCTANQCHVYRGLLDGAPNCRIYVRQSQIQEYHTDYFWGQYRSFIVGY